MSVSPEGTVDPEAAPDVWPNMMFGGGHAESALDTMSPGGGERCLFLSPLRGSI